MRPSVQIRHRASAAGAQVVLAHAGGAAVGALAEPPAFHRVHRPAAVAAAGGAGGGAVPAPGLAHRLERAGGLGEQRQAEEFVADVLRELLAGRDLAEAVGGDQDVHLGEHLQHDGDADGDIEGAVADVGAGPVGVFVVSLPIFTR